MLFYFSGSIISTSLEIYTASWPVIPPSHTTTPSPPGSTAPETRTLTKSNHNTSLTQGEFLNVTLQSYTILDTIEALKPARNF